MEKKMMRAHQVSTFAIALFIASLAIFVGLSASTCYAQELPWSNETIILPTPPLPPIFSNFSIEPTEIQLGEYLSISFVIENTNNRSITWLSTTRIGDFFTQIIEIELEPYESKVVWYTITPHIAQGAPYDVWIDGQTGSFTVIPPDPLPITNETDPVIIVTDALEELNLRIDDLDTTLQDLSGELINLRTAYDDLQDADAHLKSDQIHEYEQIVELEQALETYSYEVNEQIETLENKISNLQTNILYACIATAIIAILGAFLLIKRVQ